MKPAYYPFSSKAFTIYKHLVLITITLLISYLPGQPKAEARYFDVPARNIIKAQQFDLHDVRLLDSPFKSAMDKDAAYMLNLDPDRLLAPYRKAAGLKPKAQNYRGWEDTGLDGHTLGHYLSALSLMSAASDNAECNQRVVYIVHTLAGIQKAIGTGYVGGIPDGPRIFSEIAAGKISINPESGLGGINGAWVPWYNLHKLFAGLRDAWLYTNNQEARQVLIKLSDWTVKLSSRLSDDQFREMMKAEFGGMNEVLADVYAITGDKKYLKVAERFNDPTVFTPLSQGEDKLEGLHANTQIPKIIGAAREYELTGYDTYRQVASFFWKTVIDNRTYANGGNSMNEHFGPLHELSRQLNKNTSETCNTYNMLKLTEHLMAWHPDDPQYAAYYENALYNHILASQDPDTGMVCYYVPLVSGHFKTFSSRENSFWCCLGTGMENHAKYARNIYLHTGTDLYVNLFIPSELHWQAKGVVLRQETGFPQEQSTTLTISVNSPVRFNLKIRKPDWARAGFAVTVNGGKIGMPAQSAYVTINREWKKGDTIKVALPMSLRAEPLGTDNGQVALKYGPLLLVGELGDAGMQKPPIPYAGFEGFDGRWDQTRYNDLPLVEAPKLNVGTKPLADWVIPVKGRPLHFKTNGIGNPTDVELAPFYEVNHQHYAVYWNIKSGSK